MHHHLVQAKLDAILKYDNFNINCDENTIERVEQFKILGILFDEHLKLKVQLDKTLKSCYSTLAILKKLKRYTSEKLRKQLVESLILSNIDYCNNLYFDLPNYQKDRITKLQQSCAGFIYKRYGTIEDVLKLKWLLFNERIDFAISKIIFKGLFDEKTPSYLKLQIQEQARLLRNNNNNATLVFQDKREDKSAFLEYANKIYNDLPVAVKQENSLTKTISMLKKHFYDKSLARSLS